MVHGCRFVLAIAFVTLAPGAALGADAQAAEPPKGAEDKFVGEYAGTFTPAGGKAVPGVGYVVAEQRRGEQGPSYRVVVKAVESGLVQKTVVGWGAKIDQTATLRGTEGQGKLALSGGDWKGEIADGKLTAEGKAGKFELTFTVRKSPTELAAPPAGATVLLPYEAGKAPSLGEWANPKWPTSTDGSMMVQGGDNRTKRQFDNFRLHLEFMVPPGAKGGGNSGVYILDRYEIQVLDSFGKDRYKGGCAAVYQTFAPMVNASLPAGRWQTFDIEFFGPVMKSGEAEKLPVITVRHNGIVVHKDVTIPHATGSARSRGHGAPGPIRLQDHGAPDHYRNIWIEAVSEQFRPRSPQPPPVEKVTPKKPEKKDSPFTKAQRLLLREGRGKEDK